MISKEKLLCAFVYSAYESGYCGLMLGQEKKQEHMELFKKYLQDESYFPKSEIDETQKVMMDSVYNNGTKDYIYARHLDIIKKRIEKETKQKFEKAIKSDLILHAALSCPVFFYEVIESDGSTVTGRNLFLPQKKKLTILEGLEKPVKGDIISGHWNYFLETVTDWDQLEKYKEHVESYIRNIRDNVL